MSHPVSNPIGQPFIILPVVESTNNYAMGQVQQGLAYHGTAWFAREQTAGKGQRGKSWLTTPNENIMLSVALYPQLPAANQFLLSAVLALGCYDFYKRYAGDDTRIKWPNDIYWRDRKAGGMLIENSFRGGDWLFSIAGIGINVNQTRFDPSIKNPVSLKQVTGKTFDPVELAHELCEAMELRFRMLATDPPAKIIDGYQSALYRMNETVTLKQQNRIFKTTILGVTGSGQLRTYDAVPHEFDFGEVEWVI